MRYCIEVNGIVQGVGFRPFVYRRARGLNLTGFVRNTPSGVTIEAQGGEDALKVLLDILQHDTPPLAAVRSVTCEAVAALEGEADFTILSSCGGDARTEIPPDSDLCDDCLRELFDPADRRYRYPFITCTNCGPRYSIITGIPYDRPLTTMSDFPLCEQCRAEFDDPLNRRFHAQPLACPDCGPQLRLLNAAGAAYSTDPLEGAVRLLVKGGIVAIKGVGGYHLAVDACNQGAVEELRRRKLREAKPFAIMVPDLAMARLIAEPDSVEERLLAGPERPIVLLKKRVGNPVAASVAPLSGYFGVMLPSTPLHHLLFAGRFTALVMTSGNRASDPLAYRDEEALERLAGIADAFLLHNRAIRTRVDDSVIRVFQGNPLFLRRSRGYAPRAVLLPGEQPEVLAVGAELKGVCCLTRGNQAIMSQHIGDIQNVATLDSLEDTIGHLERLLEIRPVSVAHDLHPDYLSTRFAQERTGLATVAVQHHHAHMASCMAENRLTCPVIGVIFDGTGYGEDGTVWGGEFLVGDYDGCRRLARFRPAPLPGGDAAIREPYRMALSICHAAAGDAAFDLQLAGWNTLPIQEKQLIRQMIERRINSPLTSSCGRLFDAVASLIGVRGIVSYEGQAAIELEAVAEKGVSARTYPFEIASVDRLLEFDWRPMVLAMMHDLEAGVAAADIAAGFHSTIAGAAMEICLSLRKTTGIDEVVLSGGVFQNRIMTEELSSLLAGNGFRVYTHRLVPPNDGGLALGQAVIAGRNALSSRKNCVPGKQGEDYKCV